MHLRIRLAPVLTRPQDTFVGRQRLRGAASGVSQFGLIDDAVRLYQDAGDLRGDVVLQIDHVAGVEFLAEAAGPEILMIRCPQQRDVDLDLALHPVDAALQHVVYVRARNGVAQSLFGWKAKAGVGTEDEEFLKRISAPITASVVPLT